MYRFLVTRKWLLAHVLLVLVVLGFIELGFWQLRRLHEKRTQNALVQERMHMPLVPFALLGGSSPDSMRFRRVIARGIYDVNEEVILLSRSNGDVPGNQVLTPLRASSQALIVDRGAVPLGLDRPRAPEALPVSDTVTVTGILLPSEHRGTFGATLPATGHLAAIARIDVPRLRAQLPYAVYPLYLLLQSQQPPQRGQYPVPVALSPLDEGPHLAYAIQWFLFVAIALGTYGALIRRSARSIVDGTD